MMAKSLVWWGRERGKERQLKTMVKKKLHKAKKLLSKYAAINCDIFE
jgi:hypothetical protein